MSETCRREIDERWSFCAYCGADNRPPESRPKVKGCYHQYAMRSGFCVLCGAKYKPAYMLWGPDLQPYLGIGVMAVGGGFLLAAYVLWAIHDHGTGAPRAWVNSWYNVVHTVRSARSGREGIALRGEDVLSEMVLAGFLIFGCGLSSILPNPKRQNFFNDWDNS